MSLRYASHGSLLLALLCGCQAGPAGREIGDTHFFPRPPEIPRVQYLRSFNGSSDFRRTSAFLDYLAGAKKATDYEIVKPFSVAVSKGRIYVTDSFGLQALNVFDLEDQRFFVLGKDPGAAHLKKPIHVFADEDGFKYVSDLQRRRVLVFGPQDEYVRSYGDGQSFLPVACVVHGREVYILDIAKDRVSPADPNADWDEIRRDQILVLDKETGKPLRRIGKHGSDKDGFSFASFLTVDRLGNLYVSDFLNHRVVKLDRNGNVLMSLGRHGDRVGDFAQLKGIAVDRQGLLYAVDAAFQLAQVFDNAGQPLFVMGGPRAPIAPMNLPSGIWIDYDHIDYFRHLCAPDFEPEYLILVANQLSRQNRIAVYAYGKREGLDYSGDADITTLDEAVDKQIRPLWRMPVFPAERTAVSTQRPSS